MAAFLSERSGCLRLRRSLWRDNDCTFRPDVLASETLQLGDNVQWRLADYCIRFPDLEHQQTGKQSLLHDLVHSDDGMQTGCRIFDLWLLIRSRLRQYGPMRTSTW